MSPRPQSGTVFEELKTGLAAPLAGMGLSFSSSLFGLAGSLILGFLDLQASQAQNRFYNDLEDWLSTITDIEAGEGGAARGAALSAARHAGPAERASTGSTRRSTMRWRRCPRRRAGQRRASPTTESLDKLADAVASLVQQMREEQKIVRQWAQAQQVQQSEMQRLILRATRQAPATTRRLGQRAAVEDEE